MMCKPAIAFSSLTGITRRHCVHITLHERSHLYAFVNATHTSHEHYNREATQLTGKLIWNLVNAHDLSQPDAIRTMMQRVQDELRAINGSGVQEVWATVMLAHITPERARLAWAGDAQAFWLRAADYLDSTVPHIFSQGDANLRVALATLGAPTAHVDTRDWALQPGDRIVLTRGVEFHRDAELTLSQMLEEHRQQVALELMSSATHQSPRWVGVIVHDVS